MKTNDTHGLRKELQAILIVYVGTILGGFSMGFSTVAIPDIKRISELGRNASDFFLNIPGIQASDEQLSWFGRFICFLSLISILILLSQQCEYRSDDWMYSRWNMRWKIWTEAHSASFRNTWNPRLALYVIVS